MFKFVVLLILFVVNAFGINVGLQYESPEWKALFHVDSNNSINISDELLLSKEKNLKSEMEFLLNNQTQKNICRMPARYKVLKEKFNLNISYDKCSDLTRFVNDSNASSASVIYVSSFLSSPSSFFGHLFLKLNKKDNLFFSQTVNYAAEVPKGTNGIDLMVKGVSGDFKGNITLSPYFKIIESYNVVEQRDMEEYKLTLSTNEMETLIFHIYELYGNKNNYKFFSNNCSTEILWLINAAAPKYDLSLKKKSFDTPFNVLKYLYSSNIVSEDIFVQKSMINKMVDIYNKLSYKEKNDFKLLLDSKNKIQFINESNFELIEKERLSCLLNLYYDFMFKKMNTVFEDWNDVKNISHSYQLNEEKNNNKFNNKYESYIYTKFEQHNQQIEFSPALMNKKFDKSGDVSEISLQFLNTTINTKKDNKLERFDLIKVESINDILPFYKQPSWRGRIGISQDNNNITNGEIEFGIGLSYSIIDNFRIFAIPQLYISSNIGLSDIQLISGFSYWSSKDCHLDLSYNSGLTETNKNEKKITFFKNINNVGFNIGYDDLKNSFFAGVLYRF